MNLKKVLLSAILFSAVSLFAQGAKPSAQGVKGKGETIYGVYIHPEELDAAWVKTAKDAKIGLVALHPVGGGGASKSFARYLEQVKAPAFRQSVSELRAAGIRVESAAHTLSFFLPRSMFNTHKDWFRMNEKGERTPDCNLCVSSEEAMEYISARAAKLVGVIPADDHRYHLWPDDVATGKCCCPKCKALTAADQSLMITHAILRGLRRKDKEAKLSYLAYYSTLELPRHVSPEKGVFLEFAPMNRLFNKPLSDPTCAKNRAQIAPLPDLLKFFGYQDATALDYWYDNSLQSHYRKPPTLCVVPEKVLQADRLFYEKMRIPFVTTFACYLGADYRERFDTYPDFHLLTGK